MLVDPSVTCYLMVTMCYSTHLTVIFKLFDSSAVLQSTVGIMLFNPSVTSKLAVKMMLFGPNSKL